MKTRAKTNEQLSKISSNEEMKEVGSFYEICHSKLPSDSLSQLHSCRVVMMSKKTEHDVLVRFPYRMSSCENFRGEASGGVNGIMYSALKKKWEMVGQQSLTYSYVVRGTGILDEYTEFTVDRVEDDFNKRCGGEKVAVAVILNLNTGSDPKLKEHMQYRVDHPEVLCRSS